MSEQSFENHTDAVDQFSFDELAQKRYSDARRQLKRDSELFKLSSAGQTKEWLQSYASEQIVPLYAEINRQLVANILDELSLEEMLEGTYHSLWLKAEPYKLVHPTKLVGKQPYMVQLYLSGADEKIRHEAYLQKLKKYYQCSADSEDTFNLAKQAYKNRQFSVQIEAYQFSGDDPSLYGACDGTVQVAWPQNQTSTLYANNIEIDEPQIFVAQPKLDDYWFEFEEWQNTDIATSSNNCLQSIAYYHARADYVLDWLHTSMKREPSPVLITSVNTDKSGVLVHKNYPISDAVRA